MDSEIMFPDLCPYSRRMGMVSEKGTGPEVRSDLKGPTGPTPEVDDDEYRGSAIDEFIQKLTTRREKAIRFMETEGRQVALDRDELRWRHRWYVCQWLWTRVFSGVWIVASILAMAAMIYDDTALKAWSMIFLAGCVMRAAWVLTHRQPPVGGVSYVATPSDVPDSPRD